jgi:hypothetical protein
LPPASRQPGIRLDLPTHRNGPPSRAATAATSGQSASREEIAGRHGIPQLAHTLVGETTEELEADAEAKARMIRMLSPRRLDEDPVEQPEAVEGMAPAEKPFDQYTDEEREAQHEHTRRVLIQREREQAEAEAERQAQENRSDEQRFGDHIGQLLRPETKRASNEALICSLLPEEPE